MNPRVRVIVEFIKSNLHRELTVNELSAVAGLSHSRLHRVVKAEVGMSPIHYHKLLRLQKACDLLTRTLWKIERIRLEIGYEQHSRFFRDFKAQFGLTPKEYRARHINPKLLATTKE